MTKSITLKAQSRTSGEKPAKIRATGFVPAVLYGSGKKNENLKVKSVDFDKIWEKAGESSLIDLVIDDQQPVKIIIKDLQKDVVRDSIIHIDFSRIDMDKKITVEIPLILKGESAAVKEQGGTLVKTKDYLRIECLPGELIHEVEINIDSLKDFSDVIRAGDIELPEGVEYIGDADDVLIGVSAPRAEKEVKEEEGAEEAAAEGETPKAQKDGEGGDKKEEGKKE